MLPYIGHISTDVKRKFNQFCKFYCKNLNIKVVSTQFKFADVFNVKSPIPKSLKSFVVYEFSCPACNPFYIVNKDFKEHWETDRKSHIFAHLINNKTCKALSTESCFEIINSASSSFRLKLKEAIHIIGKKLSLNKQQKDVRVSITVQPYCIFNYYFYFTLSFPFIPSSVLLSF